MMIRLTFAALVAVVFTMAIASPSTAHDRGPAFHTGAVVFATGVAQEPDGKTIYEENCRKCHGVRGIPPKAIKEKFPKVRTFDDMFVMKVSDDSMVKVMIKGIGKGEDMKSFKDKLTPAEMMAVAKYIRELGNRTKASS